MTVPRLFNMLLGVVAMLTCTMHSVLAAGYNPHPVHSGMGTAYSGPFRMDKTGKNACQFNAKKMPVRWQKYYAAMNEADWKRLGKKFICGKCLEVKGVKGHTTRGHAIKPIYVKVVDLCPSWACKKGNVDFSTLALKKITGYSWDKKKISWRIATCPDEIPSPKPSVPHAPAAGPKPHKQWSKAPAPKPRA